MYKSNSLSFLCFNVFNFGTQKVSQFVLFEWKHLFSIIFFYFHETTGAQDRFHTYAFNALSFKIFGSYNERVLLDEVTGEFKTIPRTQFIKYFPRDSYHAIAESTGCLTMLLSGPWKKHWKECCDSVITNYSWGRK